MSIILPITNLIFRDPNSRFLREQYDVNAVRLPCPVCDRDDALAAISRSDNGTETATCTRCRHFYFSKRPALAWFENFYTNEWVKGRTHGKDDVPLRTRVRTKLRTWLGRTGRPQILCHADFCRPYAPRRGNVLEVGAGSGRYLKPFAAQGLKCYAIEPSQNSAAACRAQGIEVLDSFIENADEKRYPTIDLLFSNHSVEHHFDPNNFFSFAKRLLRPGKHVCVSVPNHEALFLPTECLFILHTHSFTEISLDRILRKHGFRTVAKQVDDQLRFMAVRTDDGASTNGESAGANACLQSDVAQTIADYQTRLLRTLKLPAEALRDGGTYLCSYQTASEPYRPEQGRYDVAVRRLNPGEDETQALQAAPLLRSFLFQIREGTANDVAIEFQGSTGQVAPVFVK